MNDKRETLLGLTSWEVVKRTLAASISLVLLMGISTAWFYYRELDREREEFKNQEESKVFVLTEIMTSHFKSVVSDLLIMSEVKQLRDFIDDINSETDRGALAKALLLFCERTGLYDHIRLIDEEGREIVRVNLNNGEPHIVPEDKLQDKGQRYYFRDTLRLDQGKIFISLFDLNIEHGEIEQPLKPMIRLGMPVFDSHGDKRGIILLNYLGADLLEHFERVAGNNPAGELMLLNSDGFWLKSPRVEEEWGFMYKDRSNLTFGNAFPEAWQQISSSDSGHFDNEDGLFIFTTFTTMRPLPKSTNSSTGGPARSYEPSKDYVASRDINWKIVSRVTPATLYGCPRRLLHKLFRWDVVLLVVFTVGSWILFHSRLRRKQAEGALRKSHEELEIRVAERTSELVEVNEELEEEIAERKRMEETTEEHLHELQVFYKASTGREERIIELKSRVRQLENKLG